MVDNDIKGKIIAGYQAWFRAGENPDGGWIHWSRGKNPANSQATVEIWPDTREYPADVMRPSGFAPLGNGAEAKLFSSRTAEVIGLHFGWAKKYGIDCLALQRFYSEVVPEKAESHYNKDHLALVKAAAEDNGGLFYVMYDFSGAAAHGEAVIENTQKDWILNVEGGGLINSPNYATRNDKKVVCLWGLTGLDGHRYPNARVALALIRWFKERGYFVIGGFPDNDWASVTDDYAAVYAAVDMASPWTVGRFRPKGSKGGKVHHDGVKDFTQSENGGAEEWWARVFPIEDGYCKAHGIEYLPVAFPGFAWSGFNAGPANDYPRMAGGFFWEQIRALKTRGVDTLYLAMFDEYDEGTAFMKAAEDSTMIPQGVYFQTLAADGVWLSSDFYLRLAGAAGKVLRGEMPLTEQVPVPRSEGPVYWRSGFSPKRAYFNRTTKREEYAAVDPAITKTGEGEYFADCKIADCKIDDGSKPLTMEWRGSPDTAFEIVKEGGSVVGIKIKGDIEHMKFMELRDAN